MASRNEIKITKFWNQKIGSIDHSINEIMGSL